MRPPRGLEGRFSCKMTPPSLERTSVSGGEAGHGFRWDGGARPSAPREETMTPASKLAVLGLATALSSLVVASPALAQDNVARLQQMQRTDAQFTFVEQTGDRVEALRAILPHI